MLYTIQIANIKSLPEETKIIDITIKSSKPPWNTFAPSWEMVDAHKSGRIDKEAFTAQYLELMRTRYRRDKKIFQQLIQMALGEPVALACYCPPGVFCHRLLLKDILLSIEPRLEYIKEPSIEQVKLF